MLLDLSRLRGHDHLERRYEPSAFDLRGDDFRLRAPVELVVDVHKDARKVRLTGRLKTELECDCGRCLDPFVVPVDATLDLLFLPADENAGEGEREVAEDDLGVSFYKDEAIDLGDMMREQFYLALPMKPLCQEACRGLCPVCGINRNRETCACQSEWIDPRLDVLRSLKNGT